MIFYQNLSDRELVVVLSAGDHHAYTELYERYKNLLYIHAYKKINDQNEAEDILQELFTALWLKRGNLTLLPIFPAI